MSRLAKLSSQISSGRQSFKIKSRGVPWTISLLPGDEAAVFLKLKRNDPITDFKYQLCPPRVPSYLPPPVCCLHKPGHLPEIPPISISVAIELKSPQEFVFIYFSNAIMRSRPQCE